ncbi:MAG: DnaJ domain-containing protein [Chitinivibrionales bacterium]|nr:DnaJ domain-containing protein [Chitinivibrionales bacterium]
MNPYHVLNVSIDADDQAIRAAYLRLIQQYTPERNPIQFNVISTAYRTIDTMEKRRNFLIQNKLPDADSPFGTLSAEVTVAANRQPPSFNAFKEFLQQCQ